MTQLVPYSFNSDILPQLQAEALPGQYQGVHFTVSNPDNLIPLLDKIERWFAERDEVILVDRGQTAQGLGFVVMEWEGYAIDALFLAILTHEEVVDDFSVYTRHEEM